MAFVDVSATIIGTASIVAIPTSSGTPPLGLDTYVTTPTISAPEIVDVSSGPSAYANVQVRLTNLDSDVSLIELSSDQEPDTGAVYNLHSFINYGDGTGICLVDLNYAFQYGDFTFSIRARDAYGNYSLYSTAITVKARILYDKRNNQYQLTPAESVWESTYDDLKSGVPKTSFIVTGQYVVPYVKNSSPFDLQVSVPGTKIDIQVTKIGVSGSAENSVYSFVPSQFKTRIYLDLGLGKNFINCADEVGHRSSLIVVSAYWATILNTDAREIYSNAQLTLDEQTNAIYSRLATRLAEPLLSFQDLLPDVKSQQLLATKLAINALVSNKTEERGVEDMVKALTLNTPIYVPNNNDPERFEPLIYPLFNDQEAFGGTDIHVWPANSCITTWVAFIKFAYNLGYKLVSISEREVVFESDTGDRVAHQFDFSSEACSLTDLVLGAFCLDNFSIGLSILSKVYINFCSAMYTFDSCLNAYNKLGQERSIFDTALVSKINSPGLTLAGTKTAQATSAIFLPEDVGNLLEIVGGADPGTYLIDSYISANQVTVENSITFTGDTGLTFTLSRLKDGVIGASTSPGSTTAGTKQVTVPIDNYFSAGDVGKVIEVSLGVDSGIYTIATYIDGRNVTVTRATNFTGASYVRVHFLDYASRNLTEDPGFDGYVNVCVFRDLWDSTGKVDSSGATIAGTKYVTSSLSYFLPGDVGKSVTVRSGVDEGTYLITAYVSSSTVVTDSPSNFIGSSGVQIDVPEVPGYSTLDSYGAIPGLFYASEYPFKRNVTVVSTDATTRIVSISGYNLLDGALNAGEIITLFGTSNAAVNTKSFIVESVLTAVTLRVREAIGTSTGGICHFTHTCVFHGNRVGLVDLDYQNIPLDATAAGNGGAWGSLVGHTDGTITV